MKNLIFPDLASATSRDHQEALARGAGDAPGDETTLWWGMIVHPTDGRAALQIGDDDVAGMTTDEQAALIDSLTSDWTPEAPSR